MGILLHSLTDVFRARQEASREQYRTLSDEPRVSDTLLKFKDYYGEGHIHNHDIVSVLYEYEPKLPDEFELKRGQMILIVGIWDDGWATGFRTGLDAAEYTSLSQARQGTLMNWHRMSKDIKAFPIVCTTLPQHWKAEIEKPVPQEDTGGSVHAPQDPTVSSQKPLHESENITHNFVIAAKEDPKAGNFNVTQKDSKDQTRDLGEVFDVERPAVEYKRTESKAEDKEIPPATPEPEGDTKILP